MAFHPLYPFAADWQHLDQSSLWQQLPHGSYHIVNENFALHLLHHVCQHIGPMETGKSSGLFVWSEVGVHGAGELAACRRGLQECDGHSDTLPQ